jgi:hypothetical protein
MIAYSLAEESHFPQQGLFAAASVLDPHPSAANLFPLPAPLPCPKWERRQSAILSKGTGIDASGVLNWEIQLIFPLREENHH